MPGGLSPIRFLLRPYRRLSLLIGAAALAASLLEGMTVATFFPFISALSGTTTAQGGALGRLSSLAARMPLADPLQAALLLLIGLTLLKAIAVLLRDRWVARASGAVQHDLKERLLTRYTRLPLHFFLDNRQGQLLYNLSTACARAGTLAQKIPQAISELLKAAFILVLLLISVPEATFLLLGIGFLYHTLTRFLARKVSYHTGKERVRAGAEQSSIANELLSGIRQILAFGTPRHWMERFSEQSRIYRDLAVKDAIWLGVPKVLLEVSALLFLGGAVWLFRGGPVGSGTGLALMGMFAVGLLRVLPSLTLLGQLRMEIVGLMADAELLERFFRDPEPTVASGTLAFAGLRHGIFLEHLGFAHPGRPPLFHELHLAFHQGGATALVGSSGSGKTTLALLLLGLLQPTSGRIRVDETDLRELDLKGWRDRIGFVSQDLFILHGTIAENITFGRSGFTQRQIERAAEVARADEFVGRLPKGYRTVVGERGMKLSGGQQQRLAIARAVLHDPEILLLDEATSFLDSESEKRVQEAIEQVSRGRTVILIAHRLSTIRRADRIVVLEQGRVVEQGNHEDLVREGGRYFRLVAAGQGGP